MYRLHLLLFIFSEILPYFNSLIKKYGSLFHFKIMLRHYVIINDPVDIKVCPCRYRTWKKDPPNFRDHQIIQNIILYDQRTNIIIFLIINIHFLGFI